MFEQLHRDFATQGLTIVGVNIREGTRTIRRYAEELDLTFSLVLDAKGKITASYGVIGLPTTFLIGRDGRPVALAIGPRHWDAAPARAIIQTLLAEPEVEKSEP
jgi:peroxiredoxin